jgi:hypothetical protein
MRQRELRESVSSRVAQTMRDLAVEVGLTLVAESGTQGRRVFRESGRARLCEVPRRLRGSG